MRFSTVLFSLVLSAGLAVAGPVDASVPAVSVVGDVSSTPKFTPFEAHAPAGSKEGDGDRVEEEVTILGDEGKTTKEVSRREEYNPLDERAPIATLIICAGSRCSGRCFGINLNVIRFNRCYITRPYNSIYVAARRGLHYGVYVGRRCRGVLVPRVGVCYRITPRGDTFFKR